MMSDPELDPELRFTAQRVVELSRRAHIDPQQQARLRQALLRRHQELPAGHTQRTAGSLWSRITRPRRLSLVAPAALAGAIGFSVILLVAQLSGHPSIPSAEAARLNRVLSQSVPTVTSWTVRVNLHRVGQNSDLGCHYSVQLKPSERLYVAYHRVYFYSLGHWYRVTNGGSRSQCSTDWQWAFAELPDRLQHHRYSVRVLSSGLEEISYQSSRDGETSVGTALVQRRTGLIERLSIVERRNGVVVERDSAEYTYQRGA